MFHKIIQGERIIAFANSVNGIKLFINKSNDLKHFAIFQLPDHQGMAGCHRNLPMNHSAISARSFDKVAERYRDKFMDVTRCDDFYREFCQLLRPGHARVLDAACGPGNVSRFLMTQRPDLDSLGIDLAPRIVELARETAPSARFAVHDCRHLADLQLRFDGIICAFGLPYLSKEEAKTFIRAAGDALEPGGALYLSTMLGESKNSRLEYCSTGDPVYINYHTEEEIIDSLSERGLALFKKSRVPSPSAAAKPTTDLIVLAKKQPLPPGEA